MKHTSAHPNYVLGEGNNIFASAHDFRFELPGIIPTPNKPHHTRATKRMMNRHAKGELQEVSVQQTLFQDPLELRKNAMRRLTSRHLAGTKVVGTRQQQSMDDPMKKLVNTIRSSQFFNGHPRELKFELMAAVKKGGVYTRSVMKDRETTLLSYIEETEVVIDRTNFEKDGYDSEDGTVSLKSVQSFGRQQLEECGVPVNYSTIGHEKKNDLPIPTDTEMELSQTYGYAVDVQMMYPILMALSPQHEKKIIWFLNQVKFCSGYNLFGQINYSCRFQYGE